MHKAQTFGGARAMACSPVLKVGGAAAPSAPPVPTPMLQGVIHNYRERCNVHISVSTETGVAVFAAKSHQRSRSKTFRKWRVSRVHVYLRHPLAGGSSSNCTLWAPMTPGSQADGRIRCFGKFACCCCMRAVLGCSILQIVSK